MLPATTVRDLTSRNLHTEDLWRVSAVQITVIRPEELGAAEIAAWHSMQARSAFLANPFLSPEFAIAVGRVQPAARVAVLAEGQDITGFFPFERRGLGGGAPIAAGLTDCQGLIYAPGADWQPRMLLRACGLSAWQFDHLVAGQGPFEQYQMALAPSPVIDLTHGYDAYLATLKASSPRFCKDMRRKSNKVQREVGEIHFVADSRDVRDLHTLMSWKSDQYRRTGRSDRFGQAWIVELLEVLLATRTDHFGTVLSVMHAGEIPVAAHLNLRSGHVLAGWFPAYDTRFRRYSLGLNLRMRETEAAAAAGVHQIDMGKGFKDYKEKLKSHDIFVAEGIVTRPSPLAAVHYAHSVPTAWAIRQIRGHRPLFNASDALLRRYGRIQKALRPRSPSSTPGPKRAPRAAARKHSLASAATAMTPAVRLVSPARSELGLVLSGSWAGGPTGQASHPSAARRGHAWPRAR
jgi:CelD/BcsL family acetyltransferase involved in cellulose biosynthesis